MPPGNRSDKESDTASRQPGRGHASGDAVEEHATDAIEVAEQGPPAGAALPHQLVHWSLPLIALADQPLVRRRQLLQADLQGLKAQLKDGLERFTLLGQALDQVAAEVARAALIALALF